MGKSKVIIVMLLAAFLIFCINTPENTFARSKKKGGPESYEYTLPKPSVNKGKSGQYQVEGDKAGYSYYIFIPSTYSDTNPAGLHVHFHGMSDQHSAEKFNRWQTHFLERYNLIGINMRFDDMKLGKDVSDVVGKVEFARTAILQTAADYKVILGRGAIGCFSGGGTPAGTYYELFGRKDRTRVWPWPFCHFSIYSASIRYVFTGPNDRSQKEPRGGLPMTWLIAYGKKEWEEHSAGWKQSSPSRLKSLKQVDGKILSNKIDGPLDLYLASLEGETPDIQFKVIPDKPHTILEADVKASADMFVRSDTAFAPFVYEGDVTAKELFKIVKLANSRQLGKAKKELEKFLKSKSLDENLKKQAGDVGAAVDAVVKKFHEMVNDFKARDRVLYEYYLNRLCEQMSGDPLERELKKEIADLKRDKEHKKVMAAYAEFVKGFALVFTFEGDIRNSHVGLLEKTREALGPDAELSKIITEWLTLPKSDGNF